MIPIILALLFYLALPMKLQANGDPLPSWNDGPAKQAIVTFVAAVTEKVGTDYVPPAERIAVFDNDGTLWSEKPVYFQLLFTVDRIKELLTPASGVEDETTVQSCAGKRFRRPCRVRRKRVA